MRCGGAYAACAGAGNALVDGRLCVGGARDGGLPVRPGVRHVAPDLGRRVSEGGNGPHAVRRLREHRVLAAVAISARCGGLARSIRRLCRAEPRDLPARASADASARSPRTGDRRFGAFGNAGARWPSSDLRVARNGACARGLPVVSAFRNFRRAERSATRRSSRRGNTDRGCPRFRRSSPCRTARFRPRCATPICCRLRDPRRLTRRQSGARCSSSESPSTSIDDGSAGARRARADRRPMPRDRCRRARRARSSASDRRRRRA